MQPLHTGIMFKKPGESHYAAQRRYILANPKADRSRILHGQPIELPFSEAAHPAINPRRSKNSFSHTIFNSSNIVSIPADTARNYSAISGSTITRNCPICAQLIYHCSLYEYAWLTHCPVHRVKLEKHCPSCHNTWPRLANLDRTRCDTCGGRISLDALFLRGAHKNHEVFLINEILTEHLYRNDAPIASNCQLLEPYPRPYPDWPRSYDLVSSQDYPAFVNHIWGGQRALMKYFSREYSDIVTVEAPSEPLREPLDPYTLSENYDQRRHRDKWAWAHEDCHWEKSVRRKVLQSILSAMIEAKKGISNDVLARSTANDALRAFPLSIKTWLYLTVRIRMRPFTYRGLPTRWQFRRVLEWGYNDPVFPRPLHYVEFQNQKGNIVTARIADSQSKLLYEADLIASFNYIFKRLWHRTTFSDHHYRDVFSEDVFLALEAETRQSSYVHFNNLCEDILLIMDTENHLTLYIPTSAYRVELKLSSPQEVLELYNKLTSRCRNRECGLAPGG